MKKVRIVIVEDEPIIRADIKNHLSSLGYDVPAAVPSGEEAIEKAEQFKPDLILMDILLSDKMDGIEAAKIIMEKFDIPVIYLTAHAEDSTLQRARETAPYGYIVKPVSIDALHSTIEMAIQRHELGKRLKESENRYRMLVETMNDSLCMLDANSRIAFVNERFCDKVGYSPEEVIGRSILDFFNEQNSRIVVEQLAKRRKGEQEAYELEWSLKDGGTMHSIVSPRALFDENGTFQGSFAVITDITERRWAEEKLRESEERYRLIVENMPVLICRFLPETGIITFVNDEYCKYFKKSYEELVGHSFLELIPESEHQEVKDHFESLNKDNHVITYEHQVISPDGERWQRWIDQALFDEYDNVIEYQSIGMDLTDRRLAEEALREERDRAQTYLDLVGAIIVVLDREGRVTLINKRGCEVLGYREEEILGKSWIDCFIPEHERSLIRKGFSRAVAGKVRMGDLYENAVLTKSNEERIILWNNAVIKDADNNLISIISSGEDITERKQAEEALQESEEKYRTIVEGIEEGYYEIDLKGNLTFFNDSLCQILDHTRDELQGVNYRTFYSEGAMRNKVFQVYNEVYRTKQSANVYDWEIVGKDGEKKYIDISISLIHDPGGKALGFRGVVRDITERKRAEEEIQIKDMAIASSMSAIALADLESNISYVNSSFLKMWNFTSKEEILGKSALEFWHEKEVALAIIEALIKGENWEGELVAKRGDGSLFNVQLSANMITDQSGKPICMMASFFDITEKKIAENALRESEEKLSQIVQGSSIPTFVINSNHVITHWNRACENMTGFPADEMINTRRQWMPFYFGERPVMADLVASRSAEKDIERYYSKRFKKSSVIEGAYEAEDLFPHLGEGGRWLFFTAAPLRNSEGRITGAIETLQDITEQKIFENSLQESEKKYRMLVETMNDGIVMVDENNLVTFTNDKFCQMVGYSKDEIIGHSLESLICEDERQKFLNEMKKRREGYQEKYEIALQSSGGNRVYTIVSPRLILDEDNSYAGSFGIFTDITERKEMEEELRYSEERYRTIFETSGSAMIIIEEDMIISQANKETERITGYLKDEIIGNKKFTEFLPRNQMERLVIYHHLRRKDPNSVPNQYEFNFINRSGEGREAIAIISMIPGTNASVVSIQDITERRRLEMEILNISMLEQQRIGQNLHDDLGQILTGTGFLCELLIKKLSERSIPETVDAREIYRLIMEAKEHTRVLSRGLCPVDMDLGGITTAIKQIADNTEKVFGITCNFDYSSDILIEDSTVETQLYYIVQEAVTNSIKHGKAENLNIELKKIGERIHLNVRDDGIGIPEAIDITKGLGLRIMFYRAEVIGASINIYRDGERGTTVSCIMRG
jgi:PAS domain S-box-containing protein